MSFNARFRYIVYHLQEKFLNLLLDGGDLRFDLRTLILGHTENT